MSGTDAIEALFRKQGSAQPPRRRKRGRGFAIAAWIIGVLIVLLIAAYLIVDSGLRSAAQTLAATAVRQALPDGAVSGPVTVHIGGTSVILQYLSGSFDDVEVDVHALTIAGISAPARMSAHGVPTSIEGKIDKLEIALDLDAASLTPVLAGQGTVSALGDGTLTVDRPAAIDGVPVTVRAIEKPAVQNHALTLTTTDAQITQAPAGSDTAALTTSARGAAPVTVCVADKLPLALPLEAITVTARAATITVAGTDLALSGQIMTEKGTC